MELIEFWAPAAGACPTLGGPRRAQATEAPSTPAVIATRGARGNPSSEEHGIITLRSD